MGNTRIFQLDLGNRFKFIVEGEIGSGVNNSVSVEAERIESYLSIYNRDIKITGIEVRKIENGKIN